MPQETCFQFVPPANVVTGVDLLVVALIPSCTRALFPHTHKVPSVLIAAQWLYPVLTCFQSVPPTNVVTGVDAFVVLLVPNCAVALFPQIHRVPSVFIAAVFPLRELICFQFAPPVSVVTGVDLLIISLVPSWALAFDPQVNKFPFLKTSAGIKTSSKEYATPFSVKL